tara:strand:+ start:107 stop:1054 length:948 start_codon:yes stop_codon:yes gene_type:complete
MSESPFGQAQSPDWVAASSKLNAAVSVAFTEGPAVDAEGNVFFSDIINDRILKFSTQGRLSVFRQDSGRTNGNMFDQQGRLVSCEGSEWGPRGGRRVVRTDMKTEQIEVLSDRFEGKRYNSPNDLTIDNQGRIYFTDPCYGDRALMEMEEEAVYRIDIDGTVKQVLKQPEIERPNGIVISPDNRILYVVDSSASLGGNRKIWAFDIQVDDALVNQRVIYDFAPGRGADGIRVDAQGNLWIAAGILMPRGEGESSINPPGIYVVDPLGKLLGFISVPEDVITNLAFGGADKKTAYITAGNTLFQIRLTVPGWSVYP